MIIATTTGCYYLERAEIQKAQAEKDKEIQNKLNMLHYRLETELQRELPLASAMAAEYSTNTDINQSEFAHFANHLIEDTQHVSHFGISKQYVIQYVYPLEGNEGAIGVDYRKIITQIDDVQRAIDARQTVVAGPVDLVQGADSPKLIVRVPVFKHQHEKRHHHQHDHDHEHEHGHHTQSSEFIGMVSMVVNMDSIFQALDTEDVAGMQIAIRGLDGMGTRGEVFFGKQTGIFDGPHFSRSVSLPGGEWIIATKPQPVLRSEVSRLWTFRAVTLCIILMILLFSMVQFLDLEYRRKSERQLLNTEERLIISQQHYEMLIDNISDVIWILDVENRRFTYISPSVSKLLGYAQDEALHLGFEDLLLPTSLERLLKLMPERVKDIGENEVRTYFDQFEIQRKDHSQLWSESASRCFIHPDTSRIVIYGATRDISERRRVQEEKETLIEQLEHAKSELETLSFTDPLTGLHNRRFLDLATVDEWRRAAREEKPISMLMIDIDCFKLYNDTYGHQQGDEALRAVANVVDKSMRRAGDIAARYGGEELVCIMPGADINGVITAAERIRDGVVNLDIAHRSSVVIPVLTVSIGVVSITPRPGNEDKSEILMVNADAALYNAKKCGRNQIQAATVSSV